MLGKGNIYFDCASEESSSFELLLALYFVLTLSISMMACIMHNAYYNQNSEDTISCINMQVALWHYRSNWESVSWWLQKAISTHSRPYFQHETLLSLHSLTFDCATIFPNMSILVLSKLFDPCRKFHTPAHSKWVPVM